MKTIYVDFTNSVSQKNVLFHGGGAYTKRLLKLLSEKIDDNIEVIIFWPENYEPKTSEEKQIIACEKFKIKKISVLNCEVAFKENSILFIPLIPFRKLKFIKQIKSKNKCLKIYVTFHGLRLLDLKYDPYDKLLSKYSLLYPLFARIAYFFESHIYIKGFKLIMPYIDKVFTVSNYSLQQIVSISSPNYISYFYCGILIEDTDINQIIKEDYILFLSGNRQEKNFLRALKAFLDYKAEHPSDKTYLYTTGINSRLLNRIRNISFVNTALFDKWVKTFEYVPSPMLNDIYKQCKFVLFMSKSEGFGLPVEEAVMYSKPVLASYATAIPEVAGSSAYYVNPYNIGSIKKGIEFMLKPANLKEYEKRTLAKQVLIRSLVEDSENNLIYEILS